MSNKLALVSKDFTPEKVELIRRTIAPAATDDELSLFLYQAHRTGLDPLARQIIFSKFKSGDGEARMSIITTVDGYRLLADRTGKYAGNDDPAFEGEPTPTKASVTVYKIVDGIRCPFTATARWSEYYPGDKKGFMWRRMPYLMLGKCAEALALRKAFPAELSGLYTDTEMEQAGFVEGSYTEEPAKEQPKPQQPAQPTKTNGTANGKPKVQPKPGERNQVDSFFDFVQSSTGNYYESKQHLHNTLKPAGGWPKFDDQDDVDHKLSIAVDHANEKRQPATEAQPAVEEELAF